MRLLLPLILLTLVGCTDSVDEPIAAVKPPIVETIEKEKDNALGEEESNSSSTESSVEPERDDTPETPESDSKEVEPVTVNSESFQSLVLESDQPVLVDFWATWCGPCLKLAPVVHEIAGEFDGRMTVAKLDIDESADIAKEFGIKGIPTLLLFVDGEVVETIVGAQPKKKITSTIEEAIGE